MKNIYLLFSISVLFLFSSCTTTKIDEPEITKNELYQHIKYLASDSLKGRYPGTAEDRLAAEYIADLFESFGLEPINGSYFQEFDIPIHSKLGENNALIVEDNKYTPEAQYNPFSFSANASLEANVVFAGYGIIFQNDSLSYDDYINIDVNGKWVLILRGEPMPESTNSPFLQFADDRDKVMRAYDKGAAGVLFVNGMDFDPQDKLVELDSKKSKTSIPVLHITRSVANDILSNTNKNIEQLEESIINTIRPITLDIDKKVAATIKLEQVFMNTHNVYGILKAPVETDEYVVIGGHYDHLGLGGSDTGSRRPDTIAAHNGADDNASGVAAFIEIAEKLAANRKTLKRNVLFVAFAAEEMGLIGSKHFVNEAPIDLSQINANINLDMVGRLKENKSLQIGGVGTSDKGELILNNINKSFSFQLALSHEGYGPSDHASFYGKDVPVFFISTGAHTDYHTPEDDIEKINFDGLVDVSQFGYALADSLINMDGRLQFKEAGPKTRVTRGYKGKVTLGFMPDFTYEGNEGLRIDFVTPGKPAQLAGLENGDVIVAIDGKKVGNIHDYMYRLSSFKHDQRITVEVKRNDDILVFIVQL